jgi:hypothetical protein
MANIPLDLQRRFEQRWAARLSDRRMRNDRDEMLRLERVCLEQAEASSLLDAKAAFHHMANRYRTHAG